MMRSSKAPPCRIVYMAAGKVAVRAWALGRCDNSSWEAGDKAKKEQQGSVRVLEADGVKPVLKTLHHVLRSQISSIRPGALLSSSRSTLDSVKTFWTHILAELRR